jgi:hypothetical protein
MQNKVMPSTEQRPMVELATNAGLVVASLVFFALLFELVIFRFVLLPTDLPRNAWVDGLVRFQPGETGVWRIGDEIAARFEVNGQGWNTGSGDYLVERSDTPRIAIAGDSYVAALQVHANASFAEKIAEVTGWEAYRFGIPGGPMSQHLRIVERAVMDYAPDWVVVLIVHNDFDDTFLFTPGRYTSSFLKLRIENGRVTEEIEPVPYAPDWRDTLRQLATVRYLYYRWQLRNVVLGTPWLHDALFEKPEEQTRYEANIDTARAIAHWPEIEAATDHVFRRLDEVVRSQGARLLVVMDGNRQAIYAGDDIALSTASALNKLAADIASRHEIPFLDLHQAFAEDWDINGIRFEFARDTHWNEHAHAIAAKSIRNFIAKAN